MSQTEQAVVLDRILSPVSRCFTPEVARQLVALRAEPDIQERLNFLANRSTEGQLSTAERVEYGMYVQVIDFISILQAKAAALLAETESGTR